MLNFKLLSVEQVIDIANIISIDGVKFNWKPCKGKYYSNATTVEAYHNNDTYRFLVTCTEPQNIVMHKNGRYYNLPSDTRIKIFKYCNILERKYKINKIKERI